MTPGHLCLSFKTRVATREYLLLQLLLGYEHFSTLHPYGSIFKLFGHRTFSLILLVTCSGSCKFYFVTNMGCIF